MGMRCANKRKMSGSIATIRETITRGSKGSPRASAANMKWLIREHCDLGDTLAVVETRVRELCGENGCPDTNSVGRETLAFIDTLAALRGPQ